VARSSRWRYALPLPSRTPRPRGVSSAFRNDLLIDKAFETVLGRRFGSMSDYVDDPDFKLFKLHGSTDWGHPVAIDREGVGIPEGLESRLITAAPDLAPRPTFDFFRVREDVFVDDTTARIPAIAIPVASKSAFECPKDHVALLTRLLPEVTAILIIGWRAGEAHFLALLKAVPRHVPVTIVSSNIERARETTKPLMDVVGLSSFHIRPDPESGRIVSPGFQGLIQSSWATKRVDYARA